MLGALIVLTLLFCFLSSVTYSPYSWTQSATKIVLETIRQSDAKSQSFTHTTLSNTHGQSVTFTTPQGSKQTGQTRLNADLGSEKLFLSMKSIKIVSNGKRTNLVRRLAVICPNCLTGFQSKVLSLLLLNYMKSQLHQFPVMK